jgi:hypothetical protein
VKKLKAEVKDAILEQVRFEPEAPRKHDKGTGEILEPYRAHIKFGFECNAKNIDEAREMILREATKYFNGLLDT